MAGAARTHDSGILAESCDGVSKRGFWQAQEPVLTKVDGGGDYPLLMGLAYDTWAADGVQASESGSGVLLDGFRRPAVLTCGAQ